MIHLAHTSQISGWPFYMCKIAHLNENSPWTGPFRPKNGWLSQEHSSVAGLQPKRLHYICPQLACNGFGIDYFLSIGLSLSNRNLLKQILIYRNAEAPKPFCPPPRVMAQSHTQYARCSRAQLPSIFRYRFGHHRDVISQWRATSYQTSRRFAPASRCKEGTILQSLLT